MKRSLFAGFAALVVACGKSRASDAALSSQAIKNLPPQNAHIGLAQNAQTGISSVSTAAAPRTGMVWVGSGTLRAGSSVEEVPRVAEAELPGTEVALGGFYVDVLPWPNEPGAIPTSNVNRDEARRLCEGKGKRLCSELEWERACKGPDSTPYEYGPAFDPRPCGAGAPASASSMRPSAQRPGCRSAFGARDMHGGSSEWTDSPWGRGSTKDLGVVRGGNDVAGDLVTRCAYGRPQGPADRSPTVGFRCCAGPRNDAEVDLVVKKGPPFEHAPPDWQMSAPALEALAGAGCGPPRSPAPCSIGRAWIWRPAANVDLVVSGGCMGRDPSARCAVGVSRDIDGHIETLAQIDTGLEIPEVVLVESPDHRIRVRGADRKGQFFREIVFDYGRVGVRPVR